MVQFSRLRLLAGALLMAQAGCAQVITALDVVFPATVPGLPANGSWQSFPVRRWLTADDVEPVAMSACFAHACSEPGFAGIVRVRGREAANAKGLLADPRSLRAELQPASRRRGQVSVQRTGEGLAIHINRADGRRPVGGYATFVERNGSTLIVLTVATTEAKARALADGIVAAL